MSKKTPLQKYIDGINFYLTNTSDNPGDDFYFQAGYADAYYLFDKVIVPDFINISHVFLKMRGPFRLYEDVIIKNLRKLDNINIPVRGIVIGINLMPDLNNVYVVQTQEDIYYFKAHELDLVK